MIIQATNIEKSYNTLQVLKGITLSIDKSELVAIMGKSGAGKSTLLHILGTLDRPDQGDLIINGQAVLGLSEKELALFRNKTIGFIFQFHHLLPEFTALENVCVPGYLAKRPEKEVHKQAHHLLEYLGLSDRIQHKPAELSGGEQQRVAVARALINDPLIIFADEPTGNLDASSSKDLHQLFFKLREDFQQTFVIVTHQADLANLCDRTLQMQDGRFL